MKTILIVDDNKAILKIFEEFGKEKGFNIITAETGQEGLDLLKNNEPDIALVDLCLTGMDGITTKDGIHKISPNTEVRLMTGNVFAPAIVELVSTGENILQKPFSINDYLDKLCLEV